MSRGRHRLDVKGRRCRAVYYPGRGLHWKLPANIALQLGAIALPTALAAAGVFHAPTEPIGSTQGYTASPGTVPAFAPSTGAAITGRLVVDDLRVPAHDPVLTDAHAALSVVDNHPTPAHDATNQQVITGSHSVDEDHDLGREHGSVENHPRDHEEGQESDHGDGHRGGHGTDHGRGHGSDHSGGRSRCSGSHGNHGGGHR